MQNNFPEAPVTKTQAGHFLQEEVPVEIAASLLRVIDQIQSPGN
jgi:haloalkane dehalogenase